MKFLKTYDEVKIVPNCSGNVYEVIYEQRYTKDTRAPYLVENGRKNMVEVVRSNKDTCNYKKIIQRYEATGDISLLQKSKGVYVDMKDFPVDFVDAYDKIKRAERIFAGLDKETRSYYGNDVVKFLADFGSEKWLDAFGLSENAVVTSSEEAIKESEVKNNAADAE